MLYFTSDLHFYHTNILSKTGRPFWDVDEMDHALIQNWNARVTEEDEVYILGDLTLKGPEKAAAILRALRGKKRLIRGNHDQFADRSTFERSLLLDLSDYAEITYAGISFILFHYPIAEWNGAFQGAIHLHGHQHNPPQYNRENRKKGLLRYDVGVDANHMAPVSAEEILAFFGLAGTERPG